MFVYLFIIIISALEEWDIIDQEDLYRFNDQSQQQRPKDAAKLSAQMSTRPSLIFQIGKKVSRLWAKDNGDDAAKPCRTPLSDAEFRSYLDEEGRLVKPEQFRLAVYQGGVEASLRPVVWRHLLNIYPPHVAGQDRIAYCKRLAEQYNELKRAWQKQLKQGVVSEEMRLVANMVRKDVLRTDRTVDFYSVQAESEEEAADCNVNVLALFNVLTTYCRYSKISPGYNVNPPPKISHDIK